MSQMTHVLYLSVLFVAALSGFSARADSAEDSRGALNRSMNDFYNAAKKSPDKSAAAMKKLSAETIQPAEQDYAKKTVVEKTSDASDSKSPSDRTKKGRGSSAAGNDSSSGPAPDTSVDASKVPDMLVYPGAPKAAPKSTAQPH